MTVINYDSGAMVLIQKNKQLASDPNAALAEARRQGILPKSGDLEELRIIATEHFLGTYRAAVEGRRQLVARRRTKRLTMT